MIIASHWDLDNALLLQSAVSGLNVEKVNAIPLDDLGDDGLPSSSQVKFKAKSKGEVSCFVTHAKMWKIMLEND